MLPGLLRNCSNGRFAFTALSVLLAFSVAVSLIASSQARSKPSANRSSEDAGCRTCVSRAASLFASGQVAQAADTLREWQHRCPNNAQLHLLLSTVLWRQGGHTAEATAAAEAAVQAAPQSVPAHLQLGLLYSLADNNMRAAVELEKTVELDPSSYEAWSTLSTVYSKLHKDSKAQECSAKSTELEPGSRGVRLHTLRNLEHAGKYAEARKELKKLVSNGEYGPEFMQQLADEALTVSDWEDALQAATRVSESYPKSIAPLRVMALAQFNSHNYQDCLATAERMLKLDARSGEAMAMKGRALIQLGSTGEAERELNAALAANPEQAVGLAGQGELEYSRGHYAAASQLLMHSIDSDPSMGKTPAVTYELARALEKQGEKNTALSYYKKSLSLGLTGSDADDARQAVARLGDRAGGETR